MRLRVSSLVILFGLAVSLVARVAPAQEPTAAADSERAAVLAVVDSALAAISAEDFEGFTDLMLDEALAFPVWVEPGGKLGYRARTRADQRAMEPAADFVERGFDPEVRVQGHLVTVWLPYDFYTDGEWSHCGVGRLHLHPSTRRLADRLDGVDGRTAARLPPAPPRTTSRLSAGTCRFPERTPRHGPLGSYLAALVMYEQLTGADAREITSSTSGLSGVSADDLNTLRQAAHRASTDHRRAAR